jgi:beta-glucosidase
MPHWFADFTRTVMSRIGDRVWSAAPINEPWCVAWLSHFEGHHAPGMRDIRAASRAMHHVMKSHGASIEVMRGLGMTNLGAVVNMEWSAPASDSAADLEAAARHDAIYNRFFLGGLFHGEYPEKALEGMAPHLPEGWQDDFGLIRAPLDWIGVNYYTRKRLRAVDGPGPPMATRRPSCPRPRWGGRSTPTACAISCCASRASIPAICRST